jgi:hypothetical protein
LAQAEKETTQRSLSGFYFLRAACGILPPANCFLSKSTTGSAATIADSNTFTIALSFAFTNTAAEPASVGRGNFVQWAAFGSGSCDRANAGRHDVVWNRRRFGEI